MKHYFLIILGCFSLSAFAQNKIIFYSDLKIKNEIAFYKGEEFTGTAFIGNKNFYNFKDGLLEGNSKIENELYIYKHGIIQDYKYTDIDGTIIININNQNLAKPITSIRIGIWFNNQINDTIFFTKQLLASDSIDFKFGVILYLKNNGLQFIELTNLKLIQSRIGSKIGAYNWENAIYGYKIPAKIFRDSKVPFIFFEDIYVIHPNKNKYHLNLFTLQKIFIKYE